MLDGTESETRLKARRLRADDDDVMAVYKDDSAATSAMIPWGVETVLHAVGLASWETKVEHQDTGALDRARADVERLKHEALDEVGEPATFVRFAPAFIRRVFELCDEYRGNGAAS